MISLLTASSAEIRTWLQQVANLRAIEDVLDVRASAEAYRALATGLPAIDRSLWDTIVIDLSGEGGFVLQESADALFEGIIENPNLDKSRMRDWLVETIVGDDLRHGTDVAIKKLGQLLANEGYGLQESHARRILEYCRFRQDNVKVLRSGSRGEIWEPAYRALVQWKEEKKLDDDVLTELLTVGIRGVRSVEKELTETSVRSVLSRDDVSSAQWLKAVDAAQNWRALRLILRTPEVGQDRMVRTAVLKKVETEDFEETHREWVYDALMDTAQAGRERRKLFRHVVETSPELAVGWTKKDEVMSVLVPSDLAPLLQASNARMRQKAMLALASLKNNEHDLGGLD